jgi:Phosphoheptose isomerase
MNIRDYKQVFLCGNGGSAANATHIANDLISIGVRAHSLTADVATLTAIANDFSYEEVFSRQLEVLADPGDLLVLLSGSGSSPNIVDAAYVGREKGMYVYGLFGKFKVPRAAQHCDAWLGMGDTMQAAEEYQLEWGHQFLKKSTETAND